MCTPVTHMYIACELVSFCIHIVVCVQGGAQLATPILISNMEAGKPAHTSGKLQIGDALISVNEQSLAGSTHELGGSAPLEKLWQQSGYEGCLYAGVNRGGGGGGGGECFRRS